MKSKLKPINLCGAYLRVSTDEQAKKFSPEFQTTQIAARIARAGGVLVKTYSKDLGKSGAYLDERTDLQEAVRDIQSGIIDTLCFYDVERFSRDLEHQQRIIKTIHAAGGNLLFCTMEYEPTADGELGVNVSGVLAQRQRKKITELSIGTRMTAARDGIQTQRSRSPYGYRVINKHDVIRGTHTADRLGKYEKDPATNPHAANIFHMLHAGHSIHKIAIRMMLQDIPAPRGGKYWGVATVRNIIRNPVYMGKPAYGRTSSNYDPARIARGCKSGYHLIENPESEWIEMECEPTVSEELWRECNAILRANKIRKAGSPKSRKIFSGLIFCPQCGLRMRYDRTGSGCRGYVCPRSRPELARDYNCGRNWRNEGVLLGQVVRAITTITAMPEVVAAAYDEWQRGQNGTDNQHNLHRLEAKLSKLERQAEATASSKIEDRLKGINTDVYDNILRDLTRQREATAAEIKRLRALQKAQAAAPTLVDFSEDAAAYLSDPGVPASAKNEFLLALIERIETPQKDVAIIYFRRRDASLPYCLVWRNGVLKVEALPPVPERA
jgi:site-specific DNA recombinase